MMWGATEEIKKRCHFPFKWYLLEVEISQAGATPRFIFFSLGTLGSDYVHF